MLSKKILKNNNEKNLYLNQPYGRTGNNLYQLLGLLYMSNKLQQNFIISDNFKKHLNFLIDFDKLEQDFHIKEPKENKKLEHHFFKLYQIDSSFNPKKEYFEIGKKLRNCIKLPIKEHEDNFLYIHIRSGDTNNPQVSIYTQPSLEYYVNIIENTNYHKYIIVTEKDLVRPTIKNLKKKYPNIEIRTASLVEDVKLFLSAKNLVIGRSTFPVSLIYLNPYINNLYVCEKLINYNKSLYYDLSTLSKEEASDNLKIIYY